MLALFVACALVAIAGLHRLGSALPRRKNGNIWDSWRRDQMPLPYTKLGKHQSSFGQVTRGLQPERSPKYRKNDQ